MDFGFGGNSNSSEEQEPFNNGRGKKMYHRHTTHQIQRLEAFFKECPHPDENQRRHLSRELGLETKQIKFWFQNKRTQTKAHNDRADNSALRAENEKMQFENLAIREALKNVICTACGGPPFGEEDPQLNLQKLKNENLQLRQQYEKMTHFVSNFLGKPVGQVQTMSRLLESQADDPSLGQVLPKGLMPSLAVVNSSNPIIPHQLNVPRDVERSVMIDAALTAMVEFIKLLKVNEPLWIKSDIDERCVLRKETYGKSFPRSNHFRTSTTRTESSKASAVIAINARYLVDMFLDANKWANIFPTIVTNARTIEVIDHPRMAADKILSLQLMYQRIHILSPLVAAREFYFLRICKEIEKGLWVITDVSYDCFKDNHPQVLSSLRSWKLPSGCMIFQRPDGYSHVTWIEHVEVDDRSLTHRLYRDLVCGTASYGAPRWISSLERMIERFESQSQSVSNTPGFNNGVIHVPEGRRSVMDLSHRMVKCFWEMLSMSTGKVDVPHLAELNNNGVRFSVRHSEGPGQPGGLIVSAATSLCLPVPTDTLFNFLRDENLRTEWDVLSDGNPVKEIAGISCGSHPGNRISVLQPFSPNESQMMMLQESCIDSSGAVIVYGPIDFPAIKSVINGDDSAHIPILPSGFTISGDGRPEKTNNDGDVVFAGESAASTSGGGSSGGGGVSILTVAFQILVCNNQLPNNNNNTKELSMESVATANTLVSSTLQKIKFALNCPDDHHE